MTKKTEATPLPHLTVEWFDNSRLDSKDEIKADLIRATAGFAHLARILQKRKPQTKMADYDTPAWQYKLAHVQGQLEEIDYILKLIGPIVRNELNDR
jgi:hypothetical protein